MSKNQRKPPKTLKLPNNHNIKSNKIKRKINQNILIKYVNQFNKQISQGPQVHALARLSVAILCVFGKGFPVNHIGVTNKVTAQRLDAVS